MNATTTLIPVAGTPGAVVALASLADTRLASVLVSQVEDQLFLTSADAAATHQEIAKAIFGEDETPEYSVFSFDEKWKDFLLSGEGEYLPWVYHFLEEHSQQLKGSDEELLGALKVLAEEFPLDVVIDRLESLDPGDLKWVFRAATPDELIRRYKVVNAPSAGEA